MARETKKPVALAATPEPPAPPPAVSSPLEVAHVTFEQQQRLHGDVEARHASSAAALDAADRALGTAQQTLDEATARSAASRADDALADAAARAGVRRDHAARDRERCAAAHAALTSELESARANLEVARTAMRREEIFAEIINDGFLQAARNDARTIVGAVRTILSSVQEMRDRTNAHNSRVRDYHALGGSVDFRPRDGTADAGAIFAELAEQGGCLHTPYPHPLRYLTDVPSSYASPLANPFEAAKQLFGYLIGSLEQGAANARAGQPDRRVPELRRVAEIFLAARERVEACAKMDREDQESAAALAETHRLAHEKRLTRAANQEAEARHHRGRGRRADGSVIEPPEPVDPPEWTVG